MARAAGLDVDAIVDAALGIADADGLEGLTMRRLSGALRVSPMAIYHHVDGKETLLGLVIDQSLRALPDIDPDAAGDPGRQLRDFFLALHHLLVRHPALAQAMAARSLEGPVATVKAERALAALRRCGFDDDAVVEGFVSAFSYVLGASLYRVSRTAAGSGRSFPDIDQSATPTAHEVRQRLAADVIDDQHIRRGLDKLLTR